MVYQPLLEWVRRGETEIRPIFIDDYLNQFGAYGVVNVRAGAWNTGWHHGVDFLQWVGSKAQQDALKRVAEVSRSLHTARQRAGGKPELNEAQWHLLRAETSCNFFWGDAWVQRCHRDLDEACSWLGRATNGQ